MWYHLKLSIRKFLNQKFLDPNILTTEVSESTDSNEQTME